MGIDGMNSADIFDEYFDDEKPKYIIKNSEIEKMYELAGINKKCIDKRYEKCTGVCYDCKYFIYSPFTAEKQIAILQLLTQQCDLTISHFINVYWQDLTESEQEQIRSILNG